MSKGVEGASGLLSGAQDKLKYKKIGLNLWSDLL